MGRKADIARTNRYLIIRRRKIRSTAFAKRAQMSHESQALNLRGRLAG